MKKIKNNIDKFLISSGIMLMALPMNTHAAGIKTATNFMTKFNEFIGEYKVLITAFMGLILLTSMSQFIYNVVMLSKNADNPQKRSESIHNLLESGVLLGIQGSISLFTMLYFYMFK